MLYIISDMNITSSVRRLEREIETLRRRLLALGPLHPGSISEQYHVCRNPGCCCMHPHRPQRHGPYHKLAYVHRGQPVCRFVRSGCLREMQKRLANYKKFRGIIDRDRKSTRLNSSHVEISYAVFCLKKKKKKNK